MSPVLSRVATGQGFGSIVSYKRAYLASQGGGAYQIQRSLRFNSADSAYLNRTPGSASNRKTWTWAGWVKRATVPNAYNESYFFSSIFAPNNSDSNYFRFGFNGDRLFCGFFGTGISSAAVYRDYSAWYHIVLAVDTTQATASNRVRLYVNGSEITAFNSASYPAQNTDLAINSANAHTLGYTPDPTYGHDGYLADVFLIDGQQLDPSSFTTTDLTTGQLIPKAYSGSYGSNGWKLSFSDNSTAAALGTDSSSNGNTWTVNNLSVTAGSGNDSLVDTPTSYGTGNSGGDVRGNYCTLNPLIPFAGTISNGNIEATTPASNSTNPFVYGTFNIPPSGKWYWEYTPTAGGNDSYSGIGQPATGASKSVIYYANSGQKIVDGSASAYGATYGNNDVIGVAVNADTGSITFYKNNSSQGSITYSLADGLSAPLLADGGSASASFVINFGQRAFAYTAPEGFKALCDTNLPAPVIAKPNEVMDVKLYTGNGSTQTISGLGFSPDLVWLKRRSTTGSHRLFDTIRGATKELYSDSSEAEATDATNLTAFNSDGFSLGSGVANSSSTTYVGWTWDAGTSTVTNTAGSITSSVRANASAGFSVVTYTGTLSGSGNATVGHGLGVDPQLIITKARSGSSRWAVQMPTALSANNYLELNSTSAQASWGAQTRANPTSTTFDTIYAVGVNESGVTYVAYCFAPVAGYSSFGSYTGNGSADGVFQWCGFRPRWVMLKRTDSTDNWAIIDAARSSYNVSNNTLWPNASTAEATTYPGGAAVVPNIDFTANGFKLRAGADGSNVNAATYIYACFAESPFAYSRAR